jgi:hypothetical protein
MSNDHQRWRPFQNALQRTAQGVGIERGEALVENDHGGALQQGASNIKTAALSMRKLPAGFSDHLQESGRHGVEQVSQAEFAADFFGFAHIFIVSPASRGP